MADIADLLARSRRAHEQYKIQSPRMIPTGIGTVIAHSGDATIARTQLLEAARLRQAAHDADPQHADPAWASEPVPHLEMTAFYQKVIA